MTNALARQAWKRQIVFMPPRQSSHHAGDVRRPADKIAYGVAWTALILSALTTFWFWIGFFETDPGFKPASSAALLALGLGAFAMIPAGLAVRITRKAWRNGFTQAFGFWVLGLFLPWVILSVLLMLFAPTPILISMIALILSLILCLWALISLRLDAMETQKTRKTRMDPPA